MNKESVRAQTVFFSKAYKAYGYSNKALYSSKGKHHIRFKNLVGAWDMHKSSILDIGCGFGDLNEYIHKIGVTDYHYCGIDITKEFIAEAEKRWEFAKGYIKFIEGEFLEHDFKGECFDYIVGSEIFNLKLLNEENYDNFEDFLKKSMKLCKKSIAFNFKSDKVDYYSSEDSFYNSPEKILEISYKFSRSIVLINDYMPFEFTLLINRDDSFDSESTIFNKYMKENEHVLSKLEIGICRG